MDRDRGIEHVKQIVEALKKARKEQKVSHEKLASLTGLHRTSIGSIESGKNQPTMLSILLIASALEIDLHELLKNLKI